MACICIVPIYRVYDDDRIENIKFVIWWQEVTPATKTITTRTIIMEME